jgi:cobalt-precorrin 5A hydrolase
MKAAIFSFTKTGTTVSLNLQSYLTANGWEAKALTGRRFIHMSPKLQQIDGSLKTTVGEVFQTCRLLIFVGAAGIAVRSIAPFIRRKELDPAVIVIDERGKYIIPILSGHIGGANSEAEKLAAYLRGQAVITTATDVNHLFAVDEWAHRNHMTISSMREAKAFSAGLLEHGHAGVYCDFPIAGTLPEGLEVAGSGPLGMAITLQQDCYPFAQTVVLRPCIIHLGIGCRKGIREDAISKLVFRELRRLHIGLSQLVDINTIDIKKDETGLNRFAKDYGLPLVLHTAQQLQQVPGPFASSNFVLKTVGVDNVCERAALQGCGGSGHLMLPKTVSDGVTLAIACENFIVNFDMPQ